MKKLLLSITLLLLTCCSNPKSNYQCEIREHDYDEIADQIINWENLFSIHQDDYYCYIFSTRCTHCNNIKNLVIDTALEMDNFYFVLFDSTIPISGYVQNTIGATSYSDVSILGTPTLLRIENSTLTINIAGEKQITEYLQKPCNS